MDSLASHILRFRRAALPAACLALICGLAAQTHNREPKDVAGAADHPALPRFPGTYIYVAEQSDSTAHEFMTSDNDFISVEGRLTHLTYFFELAGKRPDEGQFLSEYREIIEKAGGRLIWKASDQSRATFTASSPSAEEVWIDLVVGKDPGAGYYFDANVVDADAAVPRTRVSAAEIERAFFRFGHIAVYGITFDEGSEKPSAASTKTLTEIAKLMKSDLHLTIDIQVHTDNSGDRVANWQMSQKRAEAIRQALIDRGIDASRLSADGYGDTRPIASNDDDEGRLRNRRVELVKTNAEPVEPLQKNVTE